MSNRIDPNLLGIANKANKAGQKVSGSGNGPAVDPGKAGGASESGAKAGAGDSVVLTERSQLLASLERKIADLPAIDRARVEAVKADIENGNYEIDVDNIADILLRTETELGE